jgi:hypothetical protein
LLSALLVVPVAAVASAAGAATAGAATAGAAPSDSTVAAAKAASKVPTLLRLQAARIGAALASQGARGLSQAQVSDLSAGVLGVDAAGGIDVLVHSGAPASAAQIAELSALGATVLASSADFAAVPGIELPSTGLVHAVVPYNQVDAVAGLSWVSALRPSLRPAVDVGPITSEGVPLHRADVAQANGLTGAGQKVGAISDDVDHLADSVAQGELPADVQVVKQAAYDGDEGTAMLEIIHDIAPGAKLAFATTGETLADYVSAFHDLAAAGATLITEDIALDDEPAFQQGIGAATAESLAQHGIWVSSSAGNLGARHAPRVSAVGTGRGPDGATGPFVGCPTAPDNTVNLRGTDNTYNLNLLPGATFLGTLQWSEPRAIFPTEGQGGFTDLNLYVMDATGTQCLAYSNSVQADGVGDTIEQLIYQNTTGAPQPVRLVVDVQGTSSARSAPLLDLRWRALSAGVQTLDPPDRAGSLNPDSNYLGFATSAGAVNASVSVDPTTVPLEPYSAAGPVQILTTTQCRGGVIGPCTGVPGGVRRTEPGPTWAASDGVSVSGAGGFGAGTCPTTVQGQCRFFGTSAAAPTAAGVAALTRQEFGGDIAPRQLNDILAARAVVRSGFGFGAGVLGAV